MKTGWHEGDGVRRRAAADRAFEYAYLLLLGVTTLMSFRYTTMLTYEQTAWLHGTVRTVRVILWALVGLKTVWQLRRWRWREIVWAVLLCGSFAASWLTVERTYILELAILVVGAWGVDVRKIAKVWFAVCAASLLATMALALGGVIENLVYYREGRRRMAFGIIYPTDFSAHVFFLAAVWAYLRGRRTTVWELAGIVALAVFCWWFCDARNTVMCLLVLAAGLGYLRLRRALAAKKGDAYRLSAPAAWLCVLSAPIFAAGMNLLSWAYDPERGWMAAADRLLSTRLTLGHQGFAEYPVRLFGQNVYMNGLGGSESLEGTYFFLDSSYVNLLLCFGAVTLLCVLGAMTVTALREKRAGAWERLGVLAVVALQCLFEHHLLEIAYNPFLLLTLAAAEGGLPEDGPPV